MAASKPALCRRNVLWWSQRYGLDAAQHSDAALSSELDGFYRAIRDNQVELVQRYVSQHPAAVFTKSVWIAYICSWLWSQIFRTALYVASFFGRHQVVKLLLRRGADKCVRGLRSKRFVPNNAGRGILSDLLCDGVRPIDVAGFASTDLVDRMKVRSLLQGDVCPQVILRLDDKSSSTDAASETRQFRVQIHFSEAVDEFTDEDVTVSDGCEVTRFSMLRADFYLATVRLVKGSSAIVEVPAGAAR
ncbi:LOW QUALITY PROTEIN: Hypothetical protein PHPALM_10508, partial [Phytophthora palmivora]